MPSKERWEARKLEWNKGGMEEGERYSGSRSYQISLSLVLILPYTATISLLYTALASVLLPSIKCH